MQVHLRAERKAASAVKDSNCPPKMGNGPLGARLIPPISNVPWVVKS